MPPEASYASTVRFLEACRMAIGEAADEDQLKELIHAAVKDFQEDGEAEESSSP